MGIQVEIEEEIYEQAKMLVEKDGISYPSIKNFVNKAVREKVNLETLNEYHNKKRRGE